MKIYNNTPSAHQAKNRHKLKSAASAGKTLLALLLCLVAGLGSAQAQWTNANGITLTPLSGGSGTTASSSTDNEGYSKICDGNTDTKFCVTGVSASNCSIYVVLQASQAMKLTGYTIVTGNDNTAWTYRNPKAWSIYGSNDNSTWTQLTSVSNDAVLQDQNAAEYTYSYSNTTAYTYFKFVFTATKASNSSSTDAVFQVSELHLHGYNTLTCAEQGASQAATDATSSLGYVFYASNNYLYNNSGSVGSTTTFTPSSCIWTWADPTNGSTISNSLNNSCRYFYYSTGSGGFKLSSGDNNRTSTCFSHSLESGTTGGKVKLYRDGTYYYLKYNSGWAADATEANATPCYFAVTKHTYSGAYQNPAISVPSEIAVTGTTTCAITTSASFTPTYFDYYFSGSAQYRFNTDYSSSIGTSAVPSSETITYTWGLEGISSDYATINSSTGVITYSTLVSDDVTATVTLTASSPSRTVKVCQEVVFRHSVSTPVITFNNSTGLVTITTANPANAAIYYTTDGEDPSVNSQPYTTSFSISAATTIKAFATATNYQPSSIAEKYIGKVATPTISRTTNSVLISCTTDGASIYYTTDGTTPTASSTLYSGAITGLASGTTVKAIAVKDDNVNSDVSSTIYYERCATPVISFDNSTNQVTITGTDGDIFRYTTNGATPTASSARYSAAFSVTSPTHVQAIATHSGYDNSEVAELQIEKVATPVISQSGTALTITCATSGATIRYTTDGTTPTAESTEYTGSISGLTSGAVVKAVAFKSQNITSDATSMTYLEQCATPTISFNSSTGQVTLGCTTTGAVLHYTLDGSIPTASSASYSSAFTLTQAATVRVIATESSHNPSAVVTLRIDQVATPVVSVSGNVLTMTCATSGATIYYTTDGSDPAASATRQAYAGAITGLATNTALRVIAVKDGCLSSAVLETTYLEQLPTPVITFTPNDPNSTASATLTCSRDDVAFTDVTYYYTTDGSTPTTSSSSCSGTVASVADQATLRVIATKTNYGTSEMASKKYVACQTATPTITITSAGVTFGCTDADAVIRYTTDGTAPTATTGTVWDGTTLTTLAHGTTIKAIATHGECQPSAVAEATNIVSGVTTDGKVILNDLEDHNWSYYAGLPNSHEATPYNTKYLGTLYSPNPRNVKITYRGGSVSGASAVAISGDSDEQQNEMVYYKTLERFVIGEFTDANRDGIPDDYTASSEWYPYTVIPNPFSKRPKLNSNYYGFAGWKVVSGASHIRRADGTTCATNAVLNLDEKIHFINLDNNYTANCISADVVLEATWTQATVQSGNATSISFTGGTYETNFYILTGNVTSLMTIGSPCTVMGRNPDGTDGNYNTYTIKGVKANADGAKIEWIKCSATGASTTAAQLFDGNGYDFTIGRGVVCSNYINAYNKFANSNTDYVNLLRVESGTYNWIRNIYEGRTMPASTTAVDIRAIYGCDYDRARSNPAVKTDTYTNKLVVRQLAVYWTTNIDNRAAGELYYRVNFKSGHHTGPDGYGADGDLFDISSTSNNGHSASNNVFYANAFQSRGQRYLLFEGGRVNAIAGGSDLDGQQGDYRGCTMRFRGNVCVVGPIYAAAQSNTSSGQRVLVFTGGKYGGWISPGANGYNTSDPGRGLYESFVYIGGNTEVNSTLFRATPRIYRVAYGGNVYGAGIGQANYQYVCGSIENGSNVILADNAYVEHAIYGGGAYGFTAACTGSGTSATLNASSEIKANIYVLGGHVGGTSCPDDSSHTLLGGVYGGASKNSGSVANIYMYGGLVEGGIYGGSNRIGNIKMNSSVNIYGGQVGTPTNNANVYGGGQGEKTVVTGSVDITLGNNTGTDAAPVVSGSAVIYGDVYGGSAFGTVNGTASTTTYHTSVTMNQATVHGDIYGGGLGDASNAAHVYGPVNVYIRGGQANNVFGCNHTNGTPQQNTNHVYMSGGDVLQSLYGGGNAAAYTGDPYVQMTGGTVHEHVFGGGLGSEAAITGSTHVTLGGNAHVMQNVYGGGNAADVSGNTYVKIE